MAGAGWWVGSRCDPTSPRSAGGPGDRPHVFSRSLRRSARRCWSQRDPFHQVLVASAQAGRLLIAQVELDGVPQDLNQIIHGRALLRHRLLGRGVSAGFGIDVGGAVGEGKQAGLFSLQRRRGRRKKPGMEQEIVGTNRPSFPPAAPRLCVSAVKASTPFAVFASFVCVARNSVSSQPRAGRIGAGACEGNYLLTLACNFD